MHCNKYQEGGDLLRIFCLEDWIKLLEEVWITHSLVQWMDWLAIPAPEYKVPNIYCLITLFPGVKKDDCKLYPSINSW